MIPRPMTPRTPSFDELHRHEAESEHAPGPDGDPSAGGPVPGRSPGRGARREGAAGSRATSRLPGRRDAERDRGHHRHRRAALAHDVLPASRRLVLCTQFPARGALAAGEPRVRTLPHRVPRARRDLHPRAAGRDDLPVERDPRLGRARRRTPLGRGPPPPRRRAGHRPPLLPPGGGAKADRSSGALGSQG